MLLSGHESPGTVDTGDPSMYTRLPRAVYGGLGADVTLASASVPSVETYLVEKT